VTPSTRRLRLAALAAATALVAACGGGGTAEPAAGGPTPSPTTSPSPSPSPTPSPAPSPSAQGTCNLANFQAELLQRVNAVRATGASCRTQGTFAPTGALAWNGMLTNAALAHSSDMAAQNFFSHTGSGGSSPGDRITAAGYAWRTYGENIAAGYPTVQAVVDGWMASDGHCANIMQAAFRDIGVACVPGTAGSSYGTYWTMDLGAR
jgi:uncharacterized protein YkwD